MGIRRASAGRNVGQGFEIGNSAEIVERAFVGAFRPKAKVGLSDGEFLVGDAGWSARPRRTATYRAGAWKDWNERQCRPGYNYQGDDCGLRPTSHLHYLKEK